MYKARAIKIQIILHGISFLFDIFMAMAILFFVIDMRGSSKYYWSSDVRKAVSFLSGVVVVFLIGGAVSLGIALRGSKLRQTGKVCPNCEAVHPGITVKCPKCGADMAYAKNVDEYLAENPTVSKSTPSAGGSIGPSNTSNTEGKTEDKTEVSDRRFCGQCGQKINSGSAFCSHCGAKQ